MFFLNPWLLLGLLGVGIPILIHLVRQQAAKPVDWGAMRFLFDTVAIRRRRIEWEDWLLIAIRCLLLALVGLALAQPFLSPDARVPWLFVLPMVLVGAVLFGGSFVIQRVSWRWILRIVGLGLIMGAGILIWMEEALNLKRFQLSEGRDIALIIDASSSMSLQQGGTTVFEKAIAEAREIVREAPPGTAFTVVLGGPAPEALTAEPLTHRADVLGVLDELHVVGGSFQAHDALGVATLALADGRNSSQEILVLSDEQRHGWRLENPGTWASLAQAWEALPSEPRLILRTFLRQAEFANLSVEEVSFSRPIVGVDREVGIQVTVANRGEVPVTAGRVTLEIAEEEKGQEPIGLLVPGQTARVEFRHRFDEPGPVSVAARLEVRDDLVADDQLGKVLVVRPAVRILIVEGNPAAEFFERASGYLALALAPRSGESLMDPEVISVTELRGEHFQDRDVIILADVARLPKSLSGPLADEVASGVGLGVLAGPRVEVEFYNDWTGAYGSLLPASLGSESVAIEGVRPAAATFDHESLSLFREAGDLSAGRLTRWREVLEIKPPGVQGAALEDGSVWLATQRYGSGRSLLVASALDARAGNLPSKQSFVPFVHELVSWLSGQGPALTVEASWSPRVLLGPSQVGLSASYQKKNQRRGGVERVDRGLSFDWGTDAAMAKLPKDHFVVAWRGTFTPPVTGRYRFWAEVDDRLEVSIGDKGTLTASLGNEEMGSLELTGGQALPFEAIFTEDGGDAYVRLYWQPPGGERSLVPAAVFQPEGVSGDQELAVIDPLGLPRKARLLSSPLGRELLVEGSAVPGLYSISLGEEGASLFSGWQGDALPLAVTADPAESSFAPMSEVDLAFLRSQLDLVRPSSAADVLSVLEGKGFGRGIWRWLVVAAIACFLLESFLSRWVARSRRVSENAGVDFGTRPAWKEGAR